MNSEERRQKIDMILAEVRKEHYSDNGIPIELWLAEEGTPEFEEWLICCTEAVDDYEAITGRKDRDSSFALYVRKYGRRERQE